MIEKNNIMVKLWTASMGCDIPFFEIGGRYMLRFIPFFFLISGIQAWAVDLERILADLGSPNGIELEVHGIDNELERYVGTYRSPGNFFDFQHFALTSEDSDIVDTLKTLRRHDKVVIRGSVPNLRRPFLHIEIVEILKITPSNLNFEEHTHGIPAELTGLSTITVKAHAVDPSGKMLVVDYNDAIFPVLVPQPHRAAAARVDRGDLLKIRFEVKTSPERPVHLSLLEEPKSLEILEHMSDFHGTPVTLEGSLVLFEASPQVIFNVFAVRKDLGNGIHREYTLVNFDDPDFFKRLREKLQDAWDKHPAEPVNVRNKFIKPGLRVRVSGKMNFVDPQQANPQILIDDLENVKF